MRVSGKRIRDGWDKAFDSFVVIHTLDAGERVLLTPATPTGGYPGICRPMK